MAKGKEIKRLRYQKTKRIVVKEEPTKVNYDNQKPIFAFYYMQYGGDHCLSRCGQQEKATVTDKLIELSQITWKQIINSPKTGSGFEKIPRKQFKVPLPSIATPEVTIKVFRHSHMGRIAGFRKNDIYHILLIGDNLYNH